MTHRRLSMGFVTLLDQALVSGGAFAVHILLARLTPPEEYGVFVLAYSAVTLAAELQLAVILEPVMVFGARRRGLDQHRYYGSTTLLQLVFTGTLMLGVWVFCAGWWVLGGRGPTLAITAIMAFGLLGIQLREYVRRLFYARVEPHRALLNDGVYLLLLLTGLALPASRGVLSAQAVFGTFAMAGVLSSVLGLLHLRVRINVASLRDVLRENWRYGRWMLASGAARWSTGEMYYWVVAMFTGVAGAGALRAMQNLFAPVLLFLMGLGNILLPTASRLVGQPPRTRLNRFLGTVSWSMAACVLLYGGLATIGAGPLTELVYSGRYADFVGLVPLLAVGYLVMAGLQGATIGLRALNKPRSVFAISTLTAAVSAVSVFPLTAVFGLRGAVAAWSLSLVVAMPVWYTAYRRAASAAVTGSGSGKAPLDDGPGAEPQPEPEH